MADMNYQHKGYDVAVFLSHQFEQDAFPLIKNLYPPKNLIIFGSRALGS
jgi:hypothetical protein